LLENDLKLKEGCLDYYKIKSYGTKKQFSEFETCISHSGKQYCFRKAYPNEYSVEKQKMSENSNWNYCNGLEIHFLKKECFEELAIETNNIDACIEADSLSPQFSVNCFEELAITNKEVSFCEYLTRSAMYGKQHCIEEVAKIINDPSFCSTDECWMDFAITENNSNYCREIELEDYPNERDDCLSSVAFNLKDSELCLEVREDYQKKQTYCLIELAQLLVDVSLCDKINPSNLDIKESGEDYFTDFCKERVEIIEEAIEKKDSSLCPESGAISSSKKNRPIFLNCKDLIND
jgi:hypothetical protein